jgi:glycerol-3-phosphate dehydrogenase
VIGAGVVGCAVARALAEGGAQTLLLESAERIGTGASGANSGILHTGFDSKPGELETQLILRSAQLREGAVAQLGVAVWRCGARLRADGSEEQMHAVERLAANARGNGVEVSLLAPGELLVPGESVTDPTAFTTALAEAALNAGATLRLGTPVETLRRAESGGVLLELSGGGSLRAPTVVNCAGLHADELAGRAAVEVYPRKGEFLVFEQPANERLEEILLPVPSSAGKGVLVFPSIDGHVIAGPTAKDRLDKRDWTVEADAAELILGPARRMLPALEGAEPIAAYAGLRPAGRGVNYAIAPSPSIEGLIDVAAIRSTGLSASLGIAEHVARLVMEAAGLDPPAPPPSPEAPPPRTIETPWWRLAAARSSGQAPR